MSNHDHDGPHHHDHAHDHATHDHAAHDHHDHDHGNDHGHGHDHAHGHDHDSHSGHSHSHGPPPKGGGKIFALAAAINLAYVGVELVYGVLAHSTALLADAAHNAGDVLGLLMAWGAAVLAMRAPSSKRTYGFRSATTLAALTNSLLILVAAGGVGWEAIARARTSTPVQGGIVAVVAIIGVGINGVSAMLFAAGRKGDANMRAAFMHLMSDAAVGVGVAIAGLLVMLTHREWIDPVTSIAVTVVILIGTVGLLRETMNLAMAGVPSHIELDKVRGFLASLPGVCEVHDLHVWPMSTTEVALTVHLVLPWPAQPPRFLASVASELEKRFGIHHVTVQLEDSQTVGCAQASLHAV